MKLSGNTDDGIRKRLVPLWMESERSQFFGSGSPDCHLKLACVAISADVVYRVQEACARPRVLRVFLFSEKGQSNLQFGVSAFGWDDWESLREGPTPVELVNLKVFA